MKTGFIRGLWGEFDKSNRITKRRFRVENNIKDILLNKFNEPFKTYVYGKENYDGLISFGVKDCVLLDCKPSGFDIVKHQYRHKLEIIKYAMEIDKYDELIYLDWDCVPKKKIDDTFWTLLRNKSEFQANLQIYRRKKCPWRTKDLRKIPNGGYIYLRNSTFPGKAIYYWEKIGRPDNDEPAWAKLTEELTNGWKGAEMYWDLFEPMVCNIHRSSPYSQELLNKKNIYFVHYQGGSSGV